MNNVQAEIAKLKGYLENEPCPNWTGSMNDAWDLFDELPGSPGIKKTNSGYMVWSQDANPMKNAFDPITDKVAPMAICLAWLFCNR